MEGSSRTARMHPRRQVLYISSRDTENTVRGSLNLTAKKLFAISQSKQEGDQEAAVMLDRTGRVLVGRLLSVMDVTN